MGACQDSHRHSSWALQRVKAASDNAIRQHDVTIAHRGSRHQHPGVCLGHHLMASASSVAAGAPAESQGCFCSVPDVPEDRSGGSTIQPPGEDSPPSPKRHRRVQSGHGRQHAGSSSQRNRRTQQSCTTDTGACNTPAAFAIDPGEAEPGHALTVKSGPPGPSDSNPQSLTSAPWSLPPHSDEDRAISNPSSSSPVTFSPASTALPQIATTAGPGS